MTPEEREEEIVRRFARELGDKAAIDLAAAIAHEIREAIEIELAKRDTWNISENLSC